MAKTVPDSLVGQVLPRVHVERHHAGASGSSIPTLQTPSKGEAPMFVPYPPRGLGYERHTVDAATGELRSLVGVVPQPVSILYNVANKPNSDSTKVTGKRKISSYYNPALRRQQCRTNQARYRDRQRNAQMQLEKRVEQLQQEVSSLKRKYRDLASREKSNQSPWRVVAEVFSLFESSFRSPWRMVIPQLTQVKPNFD
ncbi:hypothetical protein GQ600_1333 [Phytophthora cactorum]|nr:hypothetical protein GQ600_1333 [Phytophthora cactorum]